MNIVDIQYTAVTRSAESYTFYTSVVIDMFVIQWCLVLKDW